MAIDVFVSVGRTSTQQQEDFISAVEDYLRDNGFNPRTVGRSDFSSEQPLKFINSLMRECAGTVIIAFERTHIADGIDKRGSAAEKRIAGENLPTVWNQIEATLGYSMGHPLMVIVENGIRQEGLLETGYDWYVQRAAIDASTLHSREFTGVFKDWKQRVEGIHAKPRKRGGSPDPGQMTIGELISALKPAQLWAVLGALVAVITGAVWLGSRLAPMIP